MTVQATSLPFDEVFVQDGGARVRYAPEQFLGLPLHRRVAFIIGGRTSFFRHGKQVPTDLALRALRQAIAANGP